MFHSLFKTPIVVLAMGWTSHATLANTTAATTRDCALTAAKMQTPMLGQDLLSGRLTIVPDCSLGLEALGK